MPFICSRLGDRLTPVQRWYGMFYRNAFHFENLGFAATMGVFLLFIILILTVIQLKYIPSEID